VAEERKRLISELIQYGKAGAHAFASQSGEERQKGALEGQESLASASSTSFIHHIAVNWTWQNVIWHQTATLGELDCRSEMIVP
jgi:hypothetical protein